MPAAWDEFTAADRAGAAARRGARGRPAGDLVGQPPKPLAPGPAGPLAGMIPPWLVVSNNARNRLLDDIIAIRLTTTARDLPTWVKLSPADPLTGYANADCIGQLGKDELREYLGALSPASMRGVNQALAIALALA